MVRQKIISNKMLLLHATRVGLPAYIQSKVFPYRSWQPPNFRLYVPSRAAKGSEVVITEDPTTGDREQVESMDNNAENEKEASVTDAIQFEHATEAVGESLLQDPNHSPPLDTLELENHVSDLTALDVDVPGRPTTPVVEGNTEDKPEPAFLTQAAHSKKKAKTKKKKTTDDQSIQWLGDKACIHVP